MRYGLRRLEISEASSLFRLINDNRLRLLKYFPLTVSKTKNPGATKAFLLAVEKLTAAKAEYLLGMYQEDHLIGLFFIKTIDWRVPKCELAYFIDKDLEGRGITALFMQKALDFCFDQLKMHKVFLLIGLENERSKKLAERSGFQLEGVHLEDYRTGEGKLVDLAQYALFNKTIIKG